MKKEVKILIIIAVVIIGGGALLFLKGNTPSNNNGDQSIDTSALVRSNSHMTGSSSAKVNIVEFGDYQCPACGAAEPVIEKLRQDYKDNSNVNFVFRNFPLPQHDKAQISAEAAEAAAAQGQFWTMHDKLYQHQNEWTGSSDPLTILANYAQNLGLNVDQFKQDIQNNKYQSTIQADTDDGTKVNVNATPTFFINGERIVGVPKESDLKQKIDGYLAR